MAPWESRRNIFVQRVRVGRGRAHHLRRENATWPDTSGPATAHPLPQDTGGDEDFQLYGVDIDGTDPRPTPPFRAVRTTIIDPLEEIKLADDHRHEQAQPADIRPYRLNLNTGKTLLCENPGDAGLADRPRRQAARGLRHRRRRQHPRSATARAKPKEFRPVLTTNFQGESASRRSPPTTGWCMPSPTSDATRTPSC